MQPTPPTAEDFLRHLQRHETASAALETWCAMHLSADGTLSARVITETESDDALLSRQLDEPLRHRRVELCWGDTVVSSADNWYLPRRLPPAVGARLLSGDTPFGILLAEFSPHRTVIAVAPASGDHMLEITATMALPGQGNVARVREFYHRTLLQGRSAK